MFVHEAMVMLSVATYMSNAPCVSKEGQNDDAEIFQQGKTLSQEMNMSRGNTPEAKINGTSLSKRTDRLLQAFLRKRRDLLWVRRLRGNPEQAGLCFHIAVMPSELTWSSMERYIMEWELKDILGCDVLIEDERGASPARCVDFCDKWDIIIDRDVQRRVLHERVATEEWRLMRQCYSEAAGNSPYAVPARIYQFYLDHEEAELHKAELLEKQRQENLLKLAEKFNTR